jgi:hypothetical protein
VTSGQCPRMTNEERTQAKASGDTPSEVLRDTAKRTSPPGNAERDEAALRLGEERLAQAAGSH